MFISSKARILALDIATHTGWAYEDSTTFAYGTWDLSTKKDESAGMRIVRFRSKIDEVIKSLRPNVIFYELPTGKFMTPIKTESELIGVLKLLAEENAIEYKGFSVSEIKKYATGKGNASKSDMVAAAEGRYGIVVANDNEADAIHILNLAKFKYYIQ